MQTCYCTYQQNGSWRRAALTSATYEKYLKDASISNLQVHPNQSMMEATYSEIKGQDYNSKRMLLG